MKKYKFNRMNKLIFYMTSATIFLNGIAFGKNEDFRVRAIMVIIALINCWVLVITVESEIALEKNKSEVEILQKVSELIEKS